eukprot:CAMPEP_0194132662 /NCGR_PEP_ID=MMETSP0152-20130528/3077_1 /TAXON_ID=1049557 /ORGANISM="Thalassiothrix antarctica, Strain L6-D1" /LENGTH=504 /DNA_ID=CAMNT_0038827783 /DNA_START=70 /DNA_END=1584 /DNA_ORIENTATION=-
MKRGNENSQIEKEAFDALYENESSSSQSKKRQPRASLEAMRERRIFKVKNRVKTPGNRRKSMGDVKKMDENKNPFSSVSFSSSTPKNSSVSFSSSTPKNSSVSFSTSTPKNINAAPAVSFSFGNSAKKESKNNVSFNFGGNSVSNKTNEEDVSNKAIEEDDEVKKLRIKEEESLEKLEEAFQLKMKEAGDSRSHLPRDVDLYLQYYRLIRRPLDLALAKREEEKVSGNSVAATANDKRVSFDTKEPDTMNTPSAKKEKQFGGFNFGNSVATPTQTATTTPTSEFPFKKGTPGRTPIPPKGFSFQLSPLTAEKPANNSASGFSFGTTPTTAEKPASGFSFGTTPTTAVTSNTNSVNKQEKSSILPDNDTENENDMKSTVTKADDDVDWDTAYESKKIRYYLHNEKKEWKSFDKGPMKLQTQKADAKNKRLLLRDESMGKVRLNVMINDTKFTKKLSSTAGKPTRYFILFNALRTEEKGMEQIMLQCKGEDHADLLDKLNEMGGNK